MASQYPEDPLAPAATPRRNTMVERAKRLILTPKLEWTAIDAEPMTVRQIFNGWVMPLAAIGPVASLIGGQVFGYGAFGIIYRPSITGALTTAILSYAMALIGTWVLALIIDALAPTFGGTKNPVAAMKVAAFSATAGWLAGIFGIVPALAVLSILGLYSLYLLYLGLPLLMKALPDKAIGYIVATIVAAAVVFIVIGAVTTTIGSRMMAPALVGSTSGTIGVPGVGSVDLGKLDAASKQMSAAADQMQSQAKDGKPATPPATLQAMLPATIGGWSRTEVESASGGAGGIGGSNATGTYTMGSDRITVSVSDIGAMGAIAALGSAFNVQSNRQTATGYEKTGTVNGRITTEKWDSADHSGSYSVVVGSRFTVAVEGTARDAAQFKAAIDAVDLSKLQAMAAS
ncbi:Yip1 family protein [Sphingomonas bacterium]|uniref:Yip1 family protein n=1 Tax=Sphingomonas bacterium TaxID=1895847 RepID=UPI0015768595|nr:Yip1 family protein [Sphingomonas bacterium]